MGDPQGPWGPCGFRGESLASVGSGDTLTGSLRARGECRGPARVEHIRVVSFDTTVATDRPHAISSRCTLLDAKQNRIMRCAHCPLPSQLLHAPCCNLI